MDAFSLSELIKAVLDDNKAGEIQVIQVEELSSICDYMIIATGNSIQQTRALANYVVDAAKKQGVTVLGIEGQENREWILVDLGNVLVHLMLPETRAYYELEKLWTA